MGFVCLLCLFLLISCRGLSSGNPTLLLSHKTAAISFTLDSYQVRYNNKKKQRGDFQARGDI